MDTPTANSSDDMAARLGAKLLESNEFVEVGRFTYGRPRFVTFPSSSRMRIGSFCSIGDDVTFILGGEHFTERLTTYPLNVLLGDAGLPWLEKEKGPIIVGNDVWIGYGATILSGVTIGNGAVIGAGSVVASDVEAYSIVGGNPARLLRKRFPPETVSAIERLQWWDWDLPTIRKHALALLHAPRFERPEIAGNADALGLAPGTSREGRPLRLNLGSGKSKVPGYIGVDKIDFPEVDLVADLARPWPWRDSSVTEVVASHVLEHLASDERVHFFNELDRVLIDGGRAVIVTPHWQDPGCYGDPTHQWPPVTDWTYHYLSKAWRQAVAPHTGYVCDLKTTTETCRQVASIGGADYELLHLVATVWKEPRQ